MIRFHVPAVPVAQPRAGPLLVRKKDGETKVMSGAVPAKHPVHAFKATVAMAARDQYGGPPLEGPIALRIVFLMPRPKYMAAKKFKKTRVPYVRKTNDWDNLGKAVSDALKGVVWQDDGQVYDAHVLRLYASASEAPHVEVEIEEVVDVRCDQQPSLWRAAV